LDEAYAKFGALSFLSFEILSYFDIRISNLVAAKGRAKSIRVHPWQPLLKKKGASYLSA
jgi:hypothetical protein